MEPITGSILAAVFMLSITAFIAYLAYKVIKNWFVNRHAIKEEDKDNIAFTIKENMKSGNYKLIQGIFNTSTDEFVDSQVIETEEFDEELDDIHSDNRLVLYK